MAQVLTTLATTLKAQLSSGTLTLTSTVLGEAAHKRLGAALMLADGADLTLTGLADDAIPNAPQGAELRLGAGKAKLLGVEADRVELVFAAVDGRVCVALGIELKSGWAFADSFKNLNDGPFAALSVTKARFAYADGADMTLALFGDAARAWPRGLSFAGEAGIAMPATVAPLFGGGFTFASRALQGPLDPSGGHPLPVGELRAPAHPTPITLGQGAYKLTVAKPQVGVHLGPVTEAMPFQYMSLLAEGELQDTLRCRVLIPTTGDQVTVVADPLYGHASIEQVIEALPGGKGFADHLPRELRGLFDGIGLDHYSMTVTTAPAVTHIGFAISTLRPWALIPGTLELEGLSLGVDIRDPGQGQRVSAAVHARADLLPDVFDAPFDFQVELDNEGGWRVRSISGSYMGTVSLADLARGLAGPSAQVPDVLDGVHFSDFGAAVERGPSGNAYTLYGQADIILPIFETELIAGLTFVARRGAGHGHALSLHGWLHVAGEDFAVDLDLSAEQKVLTAKWQHQGDPLTLRDLAAALGWEQMPELPDWLDPGVSQVAFHYDMGAKTLVLDAKLGHGGQAILAALTPEAGANKGKRTYVAALHLDLEGALDDVPAVGAILGTGGPLELDDLRLVASSHALEEADAKALDTIVTEQLGDSAMIAESVLTGAGTAKTAGDAAFDLVASGKVFGAGVHLHVRHDGTGWRFKGGSAPGEKITLRAGLHALSERFHVTVPDTAIPQIEVHNISVEYVGETETLSLGAETSAEIEVPFVVPGHEKHTLHAEVALTVAPEDPKAPRGPKSIDAKMSAGFHVGAAEFLLSYEIGKETHAFEADWVSDDYEQFSAKDPSKNTHLHTFGLHDLLDLLGTDVSSLDDGTRALVDQLELSVRRAMLRYEPADHRLTLAGESAHYGEVLLIAQKGESGWEFVFGFEYQADASGAGGLKELPVIGPNLPDMDLGIKRLGLLVANFEREKFELPALPAMPDHTTKGGTKLKAAAQGDRMGDGALVKLIEGISVIAVIEPDRKTLGKVIDGDLTVTMGFDVKHHTLDVKAYFQGALRIGEDFELKDPWIEIAVGAENKIAMGSEIDVTVEHKTFVVPMRLTLTTEAMEGSVGLEAETENGKPVPFLEGPFGIKGLMIDSIFVELGVVYAIPGVNMGLQGGFHVGSGGNELVGADAFALVLEIVEIIPNPELISFRLQELSMQEIIVLFTDHPSDNLPDVINKFSITDLSFFWAESQVTMPDGNIAQPGFAFSGNLNILDAFQAHVALSINAAKGIAGEIAISPVHLGDVLSITGKSPGVSLLMEPYAPEGGLPKLRIPPPGASPMRGGYWRDPDNIWRAEDGTAWRRTKERFLPSQKKAASATPPRTWEVVPAGGAMAKFDTASQPHLFVTLHVSIFDAVNVEVDATLDEHGFNFDLEIAVSDIAKATIDVTATAEGFHAHADFGLHVHGQIGPLEVGGVDLGELDIDAGFDLSLEIELDRDHFYMKIEGDFEFEGDRLDLPTLELDVAPDSLEDLPELLLEHLAENAGEVFVELLEDGAKLLEMGAKFGAELAVKGVETAAKLADAAAHEAIDLVDEGATALDSAADALDAEADAFEQKADKALADAHAAVDQIDNEAVKTVANIGLEIAEVGEKAIVAVEHIASAIAHEAAEVLHKVAELADEALKVIEDIAEAVDKVVHAILDEAERIADAILDEAKKIVHAIEEEAKKIWGEIKEFLSAVGHGIEKAGKAVWHAVSKY